MTYRVLLDPRAARFLSRMAEPLQTRIKKSLTELQDSPEEKGERLAGPVFWRVRVGDYRAIYEIDRKSKRIIVLYLGHRSTVYDDLQRLL